MNDNSAIRNAVRLALLTGAGAALVMPAVFAQDAPQSAQTAQTQSSSAAAVQLGKVEVTGTRILRTSVETAQPVTIVTAKDIKATGLTTIGDVLQSLTSAGTALNTLVNNGGNGSTNIDLRNFGSNRVLVLVNGQRWTTALNGTVDLNSIPTAIIDHVEILQDGASAIYGSDAITGVINIITVKNFNGAEADAYMGMFDNNYGGKSGWDGKQQSYNFTIGSSGQRGGVVLNASYTEQDPTWQGSRVQTAEPSWTLGPAFGSSYAAGGRFQIKTGVPFEQIGSATCSSKGVCDLTPNVQPEFDPTLSNFRSFTNADRYNYSPLNYYSTPLETKAVYVQGHYDIADNLTFTTMAETNIRTSQQLLAPAPLGLGQAGISFFNGQVFGIGADNPYNPFHKDLVASSSQYCPTGTTSSGATCTPNLLLISLGLRPVGGGPRIFNQNVTDYTFRMGLNGFFNALGNEWDWDLGSNYGNDYESDRAFGGFNTGRLTTGLDSPGAAPCNGPAEPAPGKTGTWQEINGSYYQILIPGCVPVNLFGGYNAATGQGGITPAMYNYTQYENHAVIENSMRDYTGNITGPIVSLPAGPLAIAVGGEYLEQDGYDHPDALAAAGNVDETPSQPTSGRVWSQAEYVEFNIPLLADVPLAKSLSIDLANRWSQFSWTGGEEGSADFGVKHKATATTGRAQMRWQPTTDLLLRGSWAQGFRVPDLNELYLGTSTGFPGLRDPCAPNTAFGDWDPSTPLPAGCNGIQHTQPDAQIQTTRGGNPSLSPEHAISRSAGFVYNPEWLPGFDFSADYYKIDLGNRVGSLGGTLIMQECYLHQDPKYCALISTTAGGSIITNIATSNINTGEDYSRGWDVTAHYHLPATAIGNFTIGTAWTFVQSFVTVFASSSSPTGWQSSEEVGYTSIPNRKGRVSLDWNYGNWAANWTAQIIGKWFSSCSGTRIAVNECSEPNSIYTLDQDNTIGKNANGTLIYHDASVTYHVEPINTNFTFGIRNVFNKQLTGFGIIGGLYRVPGRFFYADVGVKF